jgi:NADH-quinone oxidoreductase subunit E
VQEQIAEVLARHSQERSALIPILQEVQEKLNYLPEEAVAEIAKYLRIPPSEVFGVLTFYAQFRTTPVGKNRICVCRGTACHVRGGARVLAAIQRHLGIKEGETTPDLKYTLETVACIGACALAPNMVINQDTYGRLNPQKAIEVLDQREGA